MYINKKLLNCYKSQILENFEILLKIIKLDASPSSHTIYKIIMLALLVERSIRNERTSKVFFDPDAHFKKPTFHRFRHQNQNIFSALHNQNSARQDNQRKPAAPRPKFSRASSNDADRNCPATTLLFGSWFCFTWTKCWTLSNSIPYILAMTGRDGMERRAVAVFGGALTERNDARRPDAPTTGWR